MRCHCGNRLFAYDGDGMLACTKCGRSYWDQLTAEDLEEARVEEGRVVRFDLSFKTRIPDSEVRLAARKFIRAQGDEPVEGTIEVKGARKAQGGPVTYFMQARVVEQVSV